MAYFQINLDTTVSVVTDSENKMVTRRRRTKIPDRPQGSISLWSIMRNCIGKELTKIPMPVRFLFCLEI